jgi:uncharacterized protein YbjQ (UPF0145 family)
MSKEDILISTSDNYTSSEIKAQYGVVDSQIVVGANIFRDVFAGFRDLFGGETKGYKKDLDKMKKAALNSIKEKATDFGANAIISLRLDLDEVSGGGKSMFMINAYGTAVKLEESAYKQEKVDLSPSEISIDDIEFYKQKNRTKNLIQQSDNVASDVKFEAITKFDLWDKETTLNVLKNVEDAHYGLEELEENIDDIPSKHIEDFLQRHLSEIKLQYWNIIYNTLSNRNWCNDEVLLELLKHDNHIVRFRALRLSGITKDYYKKEDTSSLKRLATFLNSDFDPSVDTKQVDKMIGNKEVYTCPYCLRETKTNNKCECGNNKYGLKSSTHEDIANHLIEISEAIDTALKDIR